MGRHASCLSLGNQTFVVRTLARAKRFLETFDLNNKVLNHNAFDQLSQLLTALVKTRTFVRVQSKISEQN